MKTDAGITKQVPDRSASAGTGHWLRRVVVNGGGRQMLWCAGDDLYGAVGGGRWSSGSRRSRCRCPSNDDDTRSGTCCRFLALTMWSCVRARGVHVTLYVMYAYDNNNNNIIKTTVGIYLRPGRLPVQAVHRPCHLRLPTRSRQRRRWRSGVELRKAEEETEKL